MMNDYQPIVPATSLPVRRRIMPTTVVTPSVSKSCTHNGCGNECEIEKKLEAARMQLEKKDIETKLKHDKAVLAAAASEQDNKNRDIEIVDRKIAASGRLDQNVIVMIFYKRK